MSKLLSYLIHPAIIPSIGLLLYFWILPEIYNSELEIKLLSIVIIGTYILPMLSMFLLKNLGYIDHMEVHDVKQRNYPLSIMTVISLAFAYFFSKYFPDVNLAFFFLSPAICSLVLLYFHSRAIKPSLHTMAMTILVVFLYLVSVKYQIGSALLIALLIMLTGLVMWARLAQNAHTKRELYLGFFLGVVGTMLSHFLLGA